MLTGPIYPRPGSNLIKVKKIVKPVEKTSKSTSVRKYTRRELEPGDTFTHVESTDEKFVTYDRNTGRKK